MSCVCKKIRKNHSGKKGRSPKPNETKKKVKNQNRNDKRGDSTTSDASGTLEVRVVWMQTNRPANNKERKKIKDVENMPNVDSLIKCIK